MFPNESTIIYLKEKIKVCDTIQARKKSQIEAFLRLAADSICLLLFFTLV